MRRAGQRLVIRLLCRHVLRNVNQHRAGAAAAGNCEGFAHYVRQLIHRAHQIVALRNRHRDASDVHLLEGILAQQGRADVAGDADNRRGIHIRRGNAGDKVGAAGTGCGEAYADAPSRTCVAIRRVTRALLVRGQNVLDAPVTLIVVQLVVYIQNRAAGVAENGIDTLFDKAFHQNLCAGTLHERTSFAV